MQLRLCNLAERANRLSRAMEFAHLPRESGHQWILQHIIYTYYIYILYTYHIHIIYILYTYYIHIIYILYAVYIFMCVCICLHMLHICVYIYMYVCIYDESNRKESDHKRYVDLQ